MLHDMQNCLHLMLVLTKKQLWVGVWCFASKIKGITPPPKKKNNWSLSCSQFVFPSETEQEAAPGTLFLFVNLSFLVFVANSLIATYRYDMIIWSQRSTKEWTLDNMVCCLRNLCFRKIVSSRRCSFYAFLRISGEPSLRMFRPQASAMSVFNRPQIPK